MLQNYFEKSSFLKNNKMKKDAYRSYIQVRYNLGKTPQEVYCELKIHARSCSPSLSTIYRWFDRFRNGEKIFKINNGQSAQLPLLLRLI
jgi:hypothetical protein